MAEDLLKGLEEAYTGDKLVTLDGMEHIRRRLSMYIGRRGDGNDPTDGIYILTKEVVDNSIDEYMMGFGKRVELTLQENTMCVRDYGRGIPLEKIVQAVSQLNTGAKFDSEVFKKSVGLNGVGLKAVNALSESFKVQSYRNGSTAWATFSRGKLIAQGEDSTTERNGTFVCFTPDDEIFPNYHFREDIIENMLHNYAYLNVGLSLTLNKNVFKSENGLLDLLNDAIDDTPLYPPIHLKGEDIEIVLTHGDKYVDTIFSFVNGQNTILGGTHLSAYKDAVAKTLKDFYKKDFTPADTRQGLIGAISIKVQEPEFEAQTKVQLGSKVMSPDGPTIQKFVGDFVGKELDNYLHKHPDVADVLLKKIQENEKERKAIQGIRKEAKERIKKASLNNRKLSDCRLHYNDKNELGKHSMIFLTEGDSASGSIKKIRNTDTQAVFSLKGKPLNSYKASKKDVYENEELALLQAALNIDEDIANLRYNYVVIATDADMDGMHIRLLLLTFFLKFYPDLVRQGHLYILQTPLFRVANKTQNTYCYSSQEKENAIAKMGKSANVTRFKGLGEISPAEFKGFIGEDIRLETVRLTSEDSIGDLLEFYMGENDAIRLDFIRDNLRSDIDNVEEAQ
ncbi:MAG: ATP-binding protein [Bacteroidales bacterium]|nr:ATP-binding protein [Bacteroidales bacterium]